MTTATAFEAAFQRAGLPARDARLQMAIAEFQNNGGSHERALALLDAAYARDGQGQASDAEEARIAVPSPVSSSGDGHRACAAKARGAMPSPNPARRGREAIRAVQATIASSLFDRITLPDGRALGAVQWHELPKLATQYRQFSRLFIVLHRKAVPADGFATVRDVVRERDLETALAEVERFNDIA